MPDAFTDLKRITKFHIPAANTPIRIDVPVGQHVIANESSARQKRGRPIGFKDKNPRKRNGANIQNGQNEEIKALGETFDIIDKISEEI